MQKLAQPEQRDVTLRARANDDGPRIVARDPRANQIILGGVAHVAAELCLRQRTVGLCQ